MSSSIADFDALVTALPLEGALIGLDLGTKTIGVAVSDPRRTIASPMETIARRKFTLDADRLLAIAEHRRVCAYVLGLPVNMDGTEGPRCQATRAFARSLAGRTPAPIAFWDERLSTAAVERMLIGFDTSRKRRAEVVDKLAAAYILQGALDRIAAIRRSAED
ncbi:Holliday junction resolvase RuvX [Hansschlegelia sp. KR7-227]|jgi:putative Holliday junction resolvase|uniref:Holliday junction resolvase RuvX n=1 Tax=Hansschlegelia sp. KR7-227 TaxID=3400914 RepID=UPI003BFDCC46